MTGKPSGFEARIFQLSNTSTCTVNYHFFQLIVTFSTEEDFDAAVKGSLATTTTTTTTASEKRSSEKSSRRDEDRKRPRLESDKPDVPPPQRKSLDELFRKTKTLPSIYWLPKGGK